MAARRLRVSGLVQGVGFRPFVWRLAHELRLDGWVRNDAAGVELVVSGTDGSLDAFARRLMAEAPPLARIAAVAVEPVEPASSPAETGFHILESGGGAVTTAVAHDTAICADCVAELCDRAGRRWRHAFITCTHCGPRYTLTRRLPYDRPQTSLAPFPLCLACAAEYADPVDRRFHAETTCCPVCGPRLQLLDVAGQALVGDAIAATLALLRAGAIVAIKGLGGFHLVCDARNAASVASLRQRKAREEKPFAVMVANPASLAGLIDPAALTDQALSILQGRERPVVLLPKDRAVDAALPGVAPGLAWLGVMLPYTPIQLLLFHEAAGRPAGTDWLAEPQSLALVMTSANPGGEPLVIGNDEAQSRLAGIADAYLCHDRDILIRCDDSVLRVAGNSRQFIRRARGYTPRAIPLRDSGPAVLATGGWFKNTLCVTRGAEAFVSQHIGDLDNAATARFLAEAAEHLLHILAVTPQALAHDRHPDFHSSQLALAWAAERGIPALAVQHHHAHIAAVLAEHGVAEPVLGLALDGVGLGEDGGAWGGELLRVDRAQCRRLAHLSTLPLPGGDRAAREPWRMAAAVLHQLGRGEEIARRWPDQPAAHGMWQLLERGGRYCPPTSSAGRWFDAAAALLGVQAVAAFEGQAAMRLEGLAAAAAAAAYASHSPTALNPLLRPLDAGWRIEADGSLNMLPLLAALLDSRDESNHSDPLSHSVKLAACFHATFAAALAEWVMAAANRERLATIALAGGCFLNEILAGELTRRLQAAGMRVLVAQHLPPNDGGLSLGQAWVARYLLES